MAFHCLPIVRGSEKMGNRIESLPPIVDKNSKVLILGSMPGAVSLAKQEYYANKNNRFWEIIYGLFNSRQRIDYKQRINFLKKKCIALWDVLESCEREGSSDSTIRKRVPNEFEGFFKRYTNIRFVFFNGRKAEESFRTLVGFDFPGIELFQYLPSTSPRNWSLSAKKTAWDIIRDQKTKKIKKI